jgi:hypothetical protein
VWKKYAIKDFVCLDLGLLGFRILIRAWLRFKLWMDRIVLTDAGRRWSRFVSASPSDLGTGSPWRDLLASIGHWNSVFTRFRDLGKGGYLEAAVRCRLH